MSCLMININFRLDSKSSEFDPKNNVLLSVHIATASRAVSQNASQAHARETPSKRVKIADVSSEALEAFIVGGQQAAALLSATCLR